MEKRGYYYDVELNKAIETAKKNQDYVDLEILDDDAKIEQKLIRGGMIDPRLPADEGYLTDKALKRWKSLINFDVVYKHNLETKKNGTWATLTNHAKKDTDKYISFKKYDRAKLLEIIRERQKETTDAAEAPFPSEF